ncbi:MAG: class I SAM-dependent methyltransferase [Actinobacteria bacterium]|nr:class I SAM-dependent methyltransferase [Actinomycetota bacterium]
MPNDPAYLRDLFDHSAWYYDAVNFVTSAGQVVLWRRDVAALAAPQPRDRLLDAFSGTGGLALQLLNRLGPEGELVLADLSPEMLQIARTRVAMQLARRRGPRPKVTFVVGDLLEENPGLGHFDVVTLGWGLRYVADVPRALARIRSFLRPGGRLVVLEFTRPHRVSWALPAQLFFRYGVPKIGSWLVRDRELEEYMRDSSAAFLKTEALAGLIAATGLTITAVHAHLGGLVTVIAAEDRNR